MAVEACAHCGARMAADALRCPNCGSVDRAVRPMGAAKKRPNVVFNRVIPLVALGFGVLAVIGAVITLGPMIAPRVEKAPAPLPPAESGFGAVRARGKLRIAADPEAPPFLARSSAGHEGFEYALMSAIAGQAKVGFELVEAPFDDLLDRVRDGSADMAIGQLSPVPSAGVAWSLSYLQYDLCLTVPASSAVSRLDQLGGATIGLYPDPATEQTITRVLADWKPRTFTTYGYFDAMVRGEIAAFVYECPLARYELRGRTDVIVTAEPVAVGTYAIALSDSAPGLRAEVDELLIELGSTGLLQGLATRWLATDDRPQDYRAASGRIVVVRGGEDLAAVAARTLGDAGRAGELRVMNADILGGGSAAVYAGMRLRAP